MFRRHKQEEDGPESWIRRATTYLCKDKSYTEIIDLIEQMERESKLEPEYEICPLCGHMATILAGLLLAHNSKKSVDKPCPASWSRVDVPNIMFKV